MTHPDFSKGFHKTTVTPLRFQVRAACYVHDVQFLSSYLHDARLSFDKVTRRGKTLSIEFERDCWEFGFTKHARSSELHIARSRLGISPVSDVRWEVADPKVFEKMVWIESIYVGASHWEQIDASELVITAPHSGFKLSITIADDLGDIKLKDLEMPYLYSEKKASEGNASDQTP